MRHFGHNIVTTELQLEECVGIQGLEEATSIGAAVLKKAKKGDKLHLEAPWLKKGGRVVVVASAAQEIDKQSGGKMIRVYVDSGKVRPRSVAGGSVEHNAWGKDELTFQPTLQQQQREITRVSIANV